MDINVNPPIALGGTYNTRDLGGYPTKDGGQTQYRRFLRSDGLQALTEAGAKQLQKEYGLSCVIDLRTTGENTRNPHPAHLGVPVFSFPLIDQVNSTSFSGPLPTSMGQLYCSLLDGSKAALHGIFRTILANPGCILYHCTAGKDRTGVVSMLLLSLAGCEDALITADYAASEANLAPLIAGQKAHFAQMGLEIPDYVLGSAPENMEMALAHFHKNYGDAESYFALLGFTQSEIGQLRQRLVQA